MPAALWLATAVLIVGAVAVHATLTRSRGVALVRVTLWAVVCILPFALIAFSGSLLGYPVIDHGGALAVVAGAGGAAYSVRGRASVPPRGRAMWTIAVLIALGATVWQVFTELAVGSVTATIVTNTLVACVVGSMTWTVVALVRGSRRLVYSITMGAIAGVASSLAGVTALSIVAIIVTAVLAATVGVAVGRPGSFARAVIGGVLIPALLGLVAIGVAGERVGVIFTGQPVHLAVQLVLGVVAVGWGILAALVFRLGERPASAPPAPRATDA